MGLVFLLPLVGTLLAWAATKRLLGPTNVGSVIVAVAVIGSVFVALTVVALVLYLMWRGNPEPPALHR